MVSGEEPHEIVLDEGSYTLREEIAPETAARDLAVMRAWAGR